MCYKEDTSQRGMKYVPVCLPYSTPPHSAYVCSVEPILVSRLSFDRNFRMKKTIRAYLSRCRTAVGGAFSDVVAVSLSRIITRKERKFIRERACQISVLRDAGRVFFLRILRFIAPFFYNFAQVP